MSCNEDFICIVKLELTGCARNFGVTCDGTGDACRNTWETCKDHCNYECVEQPIYFSSCMPPAHFPISPFPVINDGSLQRSVVKPKLGSSFNARPYVSLTLKDVPDNDCELNPYAPAALVHPNDLAGTLLGRLQNSYVWFDGRLATVYTGYSNQSFESLKKERLVIDKFDVSAGRCDGSATLTLQDTLFLANDATCPKQTDYLVATLAAGEEYFTKPLLPYQLTKEDPNISIGQLLLSQNLLSGEEENDKVQAARYALIDREIVLIEPCFNESAPAGYNFRLLARAQCGSELADHKAGAQIFLGKHFEHTHIIDVLCTFIEDCADMRDIFVNCCEEDVNAVIDRENFEEYRCRNPLQFGPALRVFFKPESIRTEINQLEMLFGFSLYTDRQTGTVKIRECRPVQDSGFVIDQCSVQTITTTMRETVNKLDVVHSLDNCSEKISDDNAGGFDTYVTDDVIRKTCDRRESKKVSERKLKTAWIDASNYFVLETEGYRIIRKYRRPMRELRVFGNSNFIDDFEEGKGVRFDHPDIQTPNGSRDKETLFEVLWVISHKEKSEVCLIENPYPAGTVDQQDCATVQAPVVACAPLECVELF